MPNPGQTTQPGFNPEHAHTYTYLLLSPIKTSLHLLSNFCVCVHNLCNPKGYNFLPEIDGLAEHQKTRVQ